MNAKLSPHRFWPCHENGLIKTIPTIPHNLYVSFKLTSLYSGLRKGMSTWNSHIGCGVSFESSWWALFHGRAKTYADWVWHSSKIGELWALFFPWGFSKVVKKACFIASFNILYPSTSFRTAFLKAMQLVQYTIRWSNIQVLSVCKRNEECVMAF